MTRLTRDVSETELAILQICWENGPVTRRQITDALYPGGGTTQYATVQKLLERLEAKGYVQHSRDEGVLVFQATITREDWISRKLQEMANKLCGGSLAPLLMNLVRAQPVTAQEFEKLRALVKELKPQTRPKDQPPA